VHRRYVPINAVILALYYSSHTRGPQVLIHHLNFVLKERYHDNKQGLCFNVSDVVAELQRGTRGEEPFETDGQVLSFQESQRVCSNMEQN